MIKYIELFKKNYEYLPRSTDEFQIGHQCFLYLIQITVY